MKHILLSVFIALAIGACNLNPVQQFKQPTTAAEVVLEGSKVINEVNILITATARVIKENYDAKLITEAEAIGWRNKLVNAARKADLAHVLIARGDINGYTAAQLVKDLLIELQKEIIKKARKEA